MLEEISLRNVGNEQIYDSYMGILRISPNELDGQVIDSASLLLTNPVDSSGNERKIVLSDSDGIKLGVYFTAKVRNTDVINGKGQGVKQNVINVVTNSDSNLFVTHNFHNRSTLVVNKKNQTDKKSPLQIYHENDAYVDAYDVLNYPIESPNDSSYFNAENKYKLINYNNSKNVHTQLMDSLFEKPKSWYDSNIGEEHRVKVAGKFIYTNNKDYEQVPILYTKDYILGHQTGHTARITQELINNYIDTAVGAERLKAQQSIITKLSFIQLDKLVWDIIQEATQGYIRHSQGRYSLLGVGTDKSISKRLFDTISPPQTSAPLLATSLAPGIVMHHAMPFRRFLFHVLRQEIRNSEDEGNNYQRLRKGVKQYLDDGKITAITKFDPGFVNDLTKEFVLCDGKELTYDNYPSVNTDNTHLFQHNDKGIVIRGNDKKPLPQATKTSLYDALATNGKVIVPSLLVIKQQSPRYIRGLNWSVKNNNLGIDNPIDFSSTNIAVGTYDNNQRKHEIVLGMDYGLTEKNYSVPGVYRLNIDWKVGENRHKHLCFYQSKSFNRTNTNGNQFGKILQLGNSNWIGYHDWTFKDYYYYRPLYWDALKPNGKTESEYEAVMDYSFTKHKVLNGNHVPNAYQQHMPVPYAGVFAWKVGNDGNPSTSDPIKDNYVIQNANETKIVSTPSVLKNQLEMINYSEGAAPIASRGGTDQANARPVWFFSKKKHKLKKNKRIERKYGNIQNGGYEIQRATDNAVNDVPRCVTSLPHQFLETEKTVHEDPYSMTVGGVKVTPDMTLSFPPTTVLLPLLKI